MTNEELKPVLIAYINNRSLSDALKALVEIIEEATENHPGFGWSQDARIIRAIIPKIEN